MSPKASLAAIRKKVQAGTTLTPTERDTWNAYYRQYNEASKKLYFPSREKMEALKAQAKKEGATRFNQWLIDKIDLGASGNVVQKEYLDRLTADLGQAENRYEQRMDEMERYRARIKELEAENTRLNGKVDEYAEEFKEILKRVAKGSK